MKQEIWKPIPNYNEYEVSNLGRVKSLKRKTPLILSPSSDGSGYLGVNLSVNNIQTYRRIHRLVALAFIGPCPNGLEACHNDGNNKNNRLDNLRYDTHKANMQESKRCNGPTSLTKLLEKKYFGQKRFYRAKLIRQDHQLGMTTKELSQKYGISMSNACHIVKRVLVTSI